RHDVSTLLLVKIKRPMTRWHYFERIAAPHDAHDARALEPVRRELDVDRHACGPREGVGSGGTAIVCKDRFAVDPDSHDLSAFVPDGQFRLAEIGDRASQIPDVARLHPVYAAGRDRERRPEQDDDDSRPHEPVSLAW